MTNFKKTYHTTMKPNLSIASRLLRQIMLSGYNPEICDKDTWCRLCTMASSLESSNYHLATSILKSLENGAKIEACFYWRLAKSFSNPKPLFNQNGVTTAPIFKAKTHTGIFIAAYYTSFNSIAIQYGKKRIGGITEESIDLNYFKYLDLWN